MRILHVTRQFFPSIGGIENVVQFLCEHLIEYGYQSDVATLNKLWSSNETLLRHETLGTIRVWRVPFIGGRRFFVAPEVLRFMGDYDLVHIHGIDFFIDYLALTKFLYHKPLIVSTHGGYFHTPWARGLKQLYFHSITRLTLACSFRVACTSYHDYQIFGQVVPEGKLCVIGDAVDEDFFSISKQVESGLLVYVGRISENKRIDRLIEVMPILIESAPEAKLCIIGSGSQTLLESLKKQAVKLGVQDAVSFVGEVDDATLKEYLTRAHLFVIASDYESFGVALLEAMAAGNVVVASNIDTFQEFIVHGRNGFLVNFSDVSLSVKVIVDALRLDLTEREKIGQKARQTAMLHSWPNITTKYISLYEEAIRSKHLRQ